MYQRHHFKSNKLRVLLRTILTFNRKPFSFGVLPLHFQAICGVWELVWCNTDRGGHWHTKNKEWCLRDETVSSWEHSVMHCASACLVSAPSRLSSWLSTSSVNQPKTNTVRKQWRLCDRCQRGGLDVWPQAPRCRVKWLSWSFTSSLLVSLIHGAIWRGIKSNILV